MGGGPIEVPELALIVLLPPLCMFHVIVYFEDEAIITKSKGKGKETEKGKGNETNIFQFLCEKPEPYIDKLGPKGPEKESSTLGIIRKN